MPEPEFGYNKLLNQVNCFFLKIYFNFVNAPLGHAVSVMSIPAAGAGVKRHPASGKGVSAFDKYNIAQTRSPRLSVFWLLKSVSVYTTLTGTDFCLFKLDLEAAPLPLWKWE